MITRIDVKNIKAIKEASITLGNITLFAGLNAVGKSTIIQSLLMLRQTYMKTGGFEKGLSLKSEEYVNLGLGKDVCAIGAGENESIQINVEFDCDYTLRTGFKQAPELDVLPTKDLSITPNFSWKDEPLFGNGFQYLSASRINPKIQYETSPYHVEIASIGKEGEYTVHYLAINKDKTIPNKNLKHPEAKSDTLLDNVNAWLSDISPSTRVNAVYYEELETATLSYRFQVEAGYVEFKPTNVGFGLTYVLPIITAILMLPTNGLLLVENPESHLHPAGQSKLAQLCAKAANAGLQIILETHSDHILNGLRVSVKQEELKDEEVNVFYFHRSPASEEHTSQITSIQIDSKGRADEWPEGFFDEWDKQLDQLLE